MQTDSSQHIRSTTSLLDIVLRLVDTTSIVGTLVLVTMLFNLHGGQTVFLAEVSAVVIYYLVAEITGLFRSWHATPLSRELSCGVWTWLIAIPVLVAVGFLTGELEACDRVLTHNGLLTWFLVTPLVISIARAAIRLIQYQLRRNGQHTRGFAVVGINDLGFTLARNIEKSPQMGLRLAGFYDDRPSHRLPIMPDDLGHCVGNIDQLVEQARSGAVHLIYITLPLRAEQRVKNVLARLADSTASVYIVPDFFVFELLHSRWTTIGGVPAVSVFENPFYGVDGVIKRLLDVVLASIFLLIAAVPMMLVAAAIKLTSPGPVFFRQKRYGLDGHPIGVWKFRSMRVMENSTVVTQATKDDPRVTPLGKFLRRSSLDELPQLFNVLDGSMSLVGPRPHANAHNEQFRKLIQGYMLRHKVKPGITGLAQVSGWRGETDTLEKMEKRVECDHRYIRDWSPWLDIKILFRTVFTVLSRQNAY